MSPLDINALDQLQALAERYQGPEYQDRLAHQIREADQMGNQSIHLNTENRQVVAAREAAVLVLFGALDDVPSHYRNSAVPRDLDLLFLQRANTLSKHPGQVAFPGGKVDDTDQDHIEAALREAEEETGLDRSGVRILGAMPTTPLPVTNFLVTPVLAWWEKPSDVFAVDTAESARVFRTPVADLVDPLNRCTVKLHRGSVTHKSPAFEVNDTLIWGFTGFLVDGILNDLGWSQPWDQKRFVAPPLGTTDATR